jgi:hypothetical protein
MFQKAELERLRARKELLVLQSDINRLLLATDWQRLRSPENGMHEAGKAARPHPLWTTALAALAGLLAVKSVRSPGAILGGMGGLGKLAATAFSIWRLIRRGKSAL